ncbi:hypothetical protein [Aliterella atlantica]
MTVSTISSQSDVVRNLYAKGILEIGILVCQFSRHGVERRKVQPSAA